jgi:hypothetical protein
VQNVKRFEYSMQLSSAINHNDFVVCKGAARFGVDRANPFSRIYVDSGNAIATVPS